MRFLFIVSVLTCLVIACRQQGKNKPVPAVRYFDLTFYDVWAGNWSIKGDSSGHYSFRSRQDSFYTGVFPDSLRDTLFRILAGIVKDTACSIQEEPCDDCAAVHLKISEAKNDTFEVIQSPGICAKIQQLRSRFEQNLYWLPPGRRDTLIEFQTTKTILPVPPMLTEPPRARRRN